MLTITQDWLDRFPNWNVQGWQVGMQVNLANAFAVLTTDQQQFINDHPPKKPAG